MAPKLLQSQLLEHLQSHLLECLRVDLADHLGLLECHADHHDEEAESLIIEEVMDEDSIALEEG